MRSRVVIGKTTLNFYLDYNTHPLHEGQNHARIGVMRRVWLVLMILVTIACSLTRPSPDSMPPTLQVSPTLFPVQNAGWLLDGICYEGLAALHNQVFILSDAAALEGFYNTLDSHCEAPAQRQSFDFASQVLVVLVMATKGCDAQFIPQNLENNHLLVQFVQEGDCPYDVIATYTGSITRPAAGELKVIVSGA
ncbi:MAG: hypothetical protein K8I82_27895 [Anaerolineae bacterium]|nr:hypothetical protein [Anaerolineae bacterium]